VIGMAKSGSKKIEDTKRLMGALVRQKPKPHDEMRVKPKAKKSKSPARKRASAKR
jgi:hypothetical protein